MIDKEFRAIIKRIKAQQARMPVLTDEGWERKAIQYAEWLAQRDGIILKDGCWAPKPRARWNGVNSKTKTRKSKYSDRSCPIFEKRISSVEWGHLEDVYNTRKDGSRGAWLCKEFIAEVTIELPYWDWQPDVIDTSDPVLMAA